MGGRRENSYRGDKQQLSAKICFTEKSICVCGPAGEATAAARAAAAPVKTGIPVVAAKTQKLPTFSRRRGGQQRAAERPGPTEARHLGGCQVESVGVGLAFAGAQKKPGAFAGRTFIGWGKGRA